MTNNETSERSTLYEVGFHIVPTLGEDGARDEAAKVFALASSRGPIASSGEPRLVRLAYTLKVPGEGRYQKFDTAYFAWAKFTAEPADIASLEEDLRHTASIIRHIVVKTVPDSDHTTAKFAAEIREAERKRERPADADAAPAGEVPAEEGKAADPVDKAIDDLAADVAKA